MKDYSNAKIYKITDQTTDRIYIGSTIKTLADRLKKHEANCKTWLRNINNIYCTSYELLEVDDYEIQLIEMFPCEDKTQVELRQGYWQRRLECVNKNIAGRSRNEWYQDNRDKVLKNKREHYQNNRDERLEHAKEYYQKSAKKIKKYRDDNKEKIQAYKNQKHDCECGGRYTTSHKALHEKTKKRQNFINNLQNYSLNRFKEILIYDNYQSNEQ